MMAISLLFLAGAICPRDAYPRIVERITDYAPQMLHAAIWLVALVALATRAYRLREA